MRMVTISKLSKLSKLPDLGKAGGLPLHLLNTHALQCQLDICCSGSAERQALHSKQGCELLPFHAFYLTQAPCCSRV